MDIDMCMHLYHTHTHTFWIYMIVWEPLIKDPASRILEVSQWPLHQLYLKSVVGIQNKQDRAPNSQGAYNLRM